MAASLDSVYEEYVDKFGSKVDATQLGNYIKRNHQGQWKYKEIRNFLKTKETASPPNNNNNNNSSNNKTKSGGTINRYGSRKSQAQSPRKERSDSSDPKRRARASKSVKRTYTLENAGQAMIGRPKSNTVGNLAGVFESRIDGSNKNKKVHHHHYVNSATSQIQQFHKLINSNSNSNSNKQNSKENSKHSSKQNSMSGSPRSPPSAWSFGTSSEILFEKQEMIDGDDNNNDNNNNNNDGNDDNDDKKDNKQEEKE